MTNKGIIKVLCQLRKNSHIEVVIEDQGCGISKKRLKNMAEPFYTTKERGTGLGLMTCYRIIQSHHGQIYFDSKKGKGTKVTILMPLNLEKGK